MPQGIDRVIEVRGPSVFARAVPDQLRRVGYHPAARVGHRKGCRAPGRGHRTTARRISAPAPRLRTAPTASNVVPASTSTSGWARLLEVPQMAGAPAGASMARWVRREYG